MVKGCFFKRSSNRTTPSYEFFLDKYPAYWQHIPGIDNAAYSSIRCYCYTYQEAVNYCLHGPNLILAPGDEGIY